MSGKLRWLVGLVVATLVWTAAARPLALFLIVRSNPTTADALVVLAGSAAQRERVNHALALYREGRSPMVLTTDDGVLVGWSSRHQRVLSTIERARDMLVDGGVPDSHIATLPERVHSTYDEAVAAAAYAREHHLRALVVVTSPYHSRRALWVFRRVLSRDGVSVSVDPPQPGDESPTAGAWWLTLRGWQSVGLEYPKLAYYVLMHR